jgi:soluble cytochrome b562
MKRLCGLLVATSFVVLGCTRAETPQEEAAPAGFDYTAHGNLAQVMRGIPFPASNIIFDTQTTDPGATVEATDPAAGQGATAQFSGVYGGWQAVENAAITLQETANLVMIPGRLCENGKPVPTDQEDFRMWAQNLAQAGADALKAAQSKNLDAMVDVSGTVSDACAMCHEKYRDVADNANRCTP